MLSKQYGKSISLVAAMEEIDFNLGDPIVQVGQRSTVVDSEDVSIGTIMEASSDF